jgi:hypothetical protein
MLNAADRKQLAAIQAKIDDAKLRSGRAELSDAEQKFLDAVALKKLRETIRNKRCPEKH